MSTSGAVPEPDAAGTASAASRPGRRLAGCLAAAVLGAGCAAGPDFAPPAPPPDRHYLPDDLPDGTSGPTASALGVRQRFVPGAPVAPTWWTLFGSAQLDAAMRAAMLRNPGLRAAQANLRASQQNLAAGYGVFYPQADAGLSGVRQRYSGTRAGIGAGLFNVFTLGATISYLLDVAGGARRTAEALGAEADNERYQLAATWLTLSGNVFNTYVALAGYAAQADATRRLVARLADQRAIALAQVAGGTASYAAVLAIDGRMAAAQAALAVLDQRRQQASHLLASLAGSAPARWRPPPLDLAALALPRDLPLSLPSALVRQRPDILAAEARLHAASANVGVATAALFPNVRLNADFGNEGETLPDTTSARGRFWHFGADAVQPLFRGGTLLHQRGAAVEGYRRALEDYRAAVLAAFAQVADALTALGNDARSLAAQAAALDAARQTLALLQANYRAGLVAYLDVLAADEQLQRAEIDTIQALAQRHQDTAALYLALGGGWTGMADALRAGTRSPGR